MKRRILKSLILQQDQADCGIACLASILKYYGSYLSFDELRRISGTTSGGTSLFGLLQAATQVGFDADGYKASEINDLHDTKCPSILHVKLDNLFDHYIVFFEFEGEFAIIGDPAKGILKLSKEELVKIWKTKHLLQLKPTERMVKSIEKSRLKRKWLFNLVKDDFNILLITVFLGVAISILSISTSVFSQKLIDDILPSKSLTRLFISLILITSLLLTSNFLAYSRGLMMARQGIDFNNRIVREFYSSILNLPKSFFDARKIGDFISRLNDTNRIQSVISTLFGVLRSFGV